MPAGPTYEPIATTTLGSAVETFSLTSIPSTYTDLKLIVVGTPTLDNYIMRFQINNVTSGGSYSQTALYGNGTSATSARGTNQDQLDLSYTGSSNTYPSFFEVDFLSYAGSTNKTCLISSSTDKNGSGAIFKSVGLFTSTSAISSIQLYALATTWKIGTTATLYGILKA